MADKQELLQDVYTSHAVNISRFDANTRREVFSLLEELFVELDGLLTRIDPTDPFRETTRFKRAEKLFQFVDSTLKKSYSSINQTTKTSLEGLAKVDGKFNSQVINKIFDIDLTNVALTPSQLKTIASKTLIEGSPLKDWWKGQELKVKGSFEREVRLGLVRGDSTQTIRKAVQKNLSIAKNDAETIVRTATQTVSNQVRLDTFEENQDVIQGLQWVSTLDKRTSAICRGLDGLKWEYRKDGSLKPVGHSKVFPGPTAHPRCRSTQVPWLRSWQSISRRTDLKADDFDKGTRASLDGQMPKEASYTTWFKRQTKKEQLDIMGSQRKLDLFNEGKLNFRQLTDFRNNPLTIEQLSRKVDTKIGRKRWPKGLIDIDDIEDELNERFNIWAPMLENKRLKGGKYENREIQLFNELGEHLTDLTGRFPKVQGLMKQESIPNWVFSDEEKISGASSKRSIGLYNGQSRKISIKARGRKKTGGYNLGNNNAVVSRNYLGASRHEIGHHLQKQLSEVDQQRWRQIYTRNSLGGTLDRNNFLSSKISDYAGTDMFEAFAESFTAYTDKEYKRGSLPKIIEDYLDEVIG